MSSSKQLICTENHFGTAAAAHAMGHGPGLASPMRLCQSEEGLCRARGGQGAGISIQPQDGKGAPPAPVTHEWGICQHKDKSLHETGEDSRDRDQEEVLEQHC